MDHENDRVARGPGANVKAVQRVLGHASAAMTLDIYADDLDNVATGLDNVISTLGIDVLR